MQKRLIPFAAALVAISVASSAPAQSTESPDLDQVMATVNGVDITLGHIAAAKATLPDQYRNLPSDVLFPGILDQLIQQTVLAQSYEGEWPARVRLALDNETRSLVAAEVIESVMAKAVTQDLVEQAYQDRYATGDKTTEYSAAHILVDEKETADQIVIDLQEGADFAMTARDMSTGPSGPRGGDLGWFGSGVMVPAFEAAVIALEPGEVSEPVETQFGWHVIKLNETRIKEAPALEDVREELELEIRQNTVSDTIQNMVDAADVDREGGATFDIKLLDLIDLTKDE